MASRTPDEFVRLQAEEHPLIHEETFVGAREVVVHLMHERAYDEAVELARGRDVLDLGCNTGYGTLRLAAVARSTVGADVNAAAIDEARRRDTSSSVEFRVVDGARLPFADGSFDLVTSFQVVEHLPDPGSFVAEVGRVLRSDGTALFTTPNAAIRLDPGCDPWNRFHVREYRAAELAQLFDPAFEHVAIRGMFAIPDVYRVEFEAVDAARRRHSRVHRPKTKPADVKARPRPRRRSYARRLLRPLVPDPVAGMLRRMLRGGRTASQTRATSTAQAKPIESMHRAASAAEPSIAPERVPAGVSTADLWYADDQLDRALDFLAICRRPRRMAPAAESIEAESVRQPIDESRRLT